MHTVATAPAVIPAIEWSIAGVGKKDAAAGGGGLRDDEAAAAAEDDEEEELAITRELNDAKAPQPLSKPRTEQPLNLLT